jgi:hypothetical protein
MYEAGLVTLAKIIVTLVAPMSIIPLMFLFAPGGDTTEPEEIFDTD